ATRTKLGEERIAWLSGVARTQIQAPLALVHASPESVWRAPAAEATDAQLESIYGPLGRPIAVYGHIHRPYIRCIAGTKMGEMLVANSGSVSLSYDGDRRASYLLLDGTSPTIRR